MSPADSATHCLRSGGQVLILTNPIAGCGPARQVVDELASGLKNKGFDTVVCPHPDELCAAITKQAGDIRCVVAAGGDGTLAEVVNKAQNLPVAVLPLGTENLVARHFAISRSATEVADLIAGGHIQPLDLARVNGRLFALMASAGFDAAVVHRLHSGRRGHIGRWSYAWPIWEALRGYSHSLIDIEIEETGERLRGGLVMVFNLPRYGGGLPIAPQARANDGLLDLCVFARSGIANLARYSTAVLLRRHARLPDYQHRLVRRVQLSSASHVPLQADGDPAGMLPATIEVLPRALSLVVPDPKKGAKVARTGDPSGIG